MAAFTSLLDPAMHTSKALEMSRLMAERKAQMNRDDTRCVSAVCPRPDNFRQPSKPLAPMIRKISAEEGVKAVDLSAPLLPRMTIAQLYKWKALLMRRIQQERDTIFFVTVDTISPTEAILVMDVELKQGALVTAGVQYVSDAQAILWRGEDFVRVAGLRDQFDSLKQMLRPILCHTEECAVCLETLADLTGGVTAGSSFACAHMICAKCAPSLTECPICRETKPMMRKRYHTTM